MSSVKSQTISRRYPRLSAGAQTLAAVGALLAALALPQLFHAVGAISGLGTVPGEIFLPMHLPIILAGLLAGPWAGAAAGLLAPIASFALTSMPSAASLPFMAVELCVYGLCAGLLTETRMPVVFKVLAVQLAGRAARAGAILAAVYIFRADGVGIAMIYSRLLLGLPGILIQLCIIPLLLYRLEKHGSDINE